jgi:hypothetical protein
MHCATPRAPYCELEFEVSQLFSVVLLGRIIVLYAMSSFNWTNLDLVAHCGIQKYETWKCVWRSLGPVSRLEVG